MKAEIIAVGTELLMGETQDTNSSWIGQRLPEFGLELEFVTIVGDDIARLTDTLRRAWGRSEIVIVMGGLGPTLDDLTRDGIAGMLGEEITTDPELKVWLEENFSRRKHPADAPAEPASGRHHPLCQGDPERHGNCPQLVDRQGRQDPLHAAGPSP